ncbi:MAG: YwiC-like family protein [Kofleriaceae bacterium]|nr:YwiC-like family protein [Kofleriaceae bacterium]
MTAGHEPRSAKTRSLWPREHGAYAQLGVPLLTALVLARPTTAALLLAAGACLAFLANEPLLVVLGHRGPRVKAEAGRQARVRLGVLAAGAIVCGGAGLALAPDHARLLCAVLAVPVLVLVAIAWRRAQHSLWGELVATIALPGASAPIAAASGVSLAIAGELWLAWSIGFAASVVAVHDVIGNRRGRTRATTVHAALLAALAAIVGVVAFVRPLQAPAVPLVALSAVVAILSPSPRKLRTIGVVLVVASLASSALVAVR